MTKADKTKELLKRWANGGSPSVENSPEPALRQDQIMSIFKLAQDVDPVANTLNIHLPCR